jgi:hypothetical protein
MEKSELLTLEEIHSMENQPETIRIEFIRYNNWATHQVLQACQNLSEDQLDTAAPCFTSSGQKQTTSAG